MLTAKVFENGRSQAIRLPKEYRFNDTEVNIQKVGNIVMLIPKNNNWDDLLNSLSIFTDDFCLNKTTEVKDKRETL